MIQIKRVYEKPAKSDGWRVLVDRLWPRGVKKAAAKADVWMKEIAPSDALRKSYGHELDKWPEFQKRYHAELAKKKELLDELHKMEKEHGTLTLIFASKDEEHSQAVVLAKILRKRK